MRLALPSSLLLLVSALLLLLEWLGGARFAFDVMAIRELAEWRGAHPRATAAAIHYTHLGSGPVLLTLAAAGAIYLWWRGARAAAAALVAAVLATRLGIEGIKLLVGRSRPMFDAHPVETFSASFPSGHAGNSMATFLALALFVAPAQWRRTAVAGAVTSALAMGATRPLLGVHWPTDVLAGWMLGAGVTATAWWWVSRRSARTSA